jgi:hypothetical protein
MDRVAAWISGLILVGGCATPIPPSPIPGSRLIGMARLRVDYYLGTFDGFQESTSVADRKAFAADEADLSRRRMAAWLSESMFTEVREGSAGAKEVSLELNISNDSTGWGGSLKTKVYTYSAAFRGRLTVKSGTGVAIADYFARMEVSGKPTSAEAVRAGLIAVETRLLKDLVADKAARDRMQSVLVGMPIQPPPNAGPTAAAPPKLAPPPPKPALPKVVTPVASPKPATSMRPAPWVPGPSDALWALRPKPADPEGSGLYSLENETAFNVLDGAVLDVARGTVTLYGHWDDRVAGPRIPWLQHLAELLEHPQPQFSLGWTTESSKEVDRFLAASSTHKERMRAAADWGAVFTPAGTISDVGRLLLPGLGVHPTRNGAAPGDAGLTVAWKKNPLQEYLEVMSVAAGSAGQAAGLTVGDRIFTLDDRIPIHEKNFAWQIRAMGAGTSCKMWVRKGEAEGRMVTLTLKAAPGDPWEGLGRNDLAVCIFRSAGMTDAAEVTYWTDAWHATKEGPHEDQMWLAFLNALGLEGTYKKYDRMIRKGEKNKAEAMNEILRGVAAGIDKAFRLEGSPGTKAWDAAHRKTGDPLRALDEAFGVLETARKGALGKALDSLRARPGGVQIAPELIESTYRVRPVVQPEYIDVDGTSPLARVLFEADYIGKRLVHTPALAQRVPGYLTVFEFERRNPNGVRRTGGTQTYRMWISVGRMAAAESADGSTLELRDAQMQFNIRERDAGGRDLPPAPGGYEALLTSLYEPFSRQFPVLHELRECAKLAAVAKWILAKRPGTTFPKEGRVAWRGPASLPGLIYMYLYPSDGKSPIDTTIIAAGGCSLKLPIDAFPADAGVVDLRGSPLTIAPEAYRNATLSRIMGRKVEVPEWRPEGWVTRARKGERALSAVHVSIAGRNPNSDLALRAKLEEARQAADRLAQVERAINVLTAKNVDRQAELQALRASIEKSEAEFVEASLKLLTSGLCNLKAVSAHPNLVLAAKEAQAMKEELEILETAVAHAETAWNAARADDAKQRAQVVIGVTKALGKVLDAGTSKALGPLRPYLNPVKKSLGWASKLEDAYQIGSSLNTLRSAGNRIEALDFQAEREGAALRDSLLPMQKSCSDALDRLRQDPDIRRATGG